MPEVMRVAIGLPSDCREEHLRFARQLGCEGIILQSPKRLPGDHRWEYADIAALCEWVGSYGLRIEALSVPHKFWQKVRLGLPGRDEEIENLLVTIRNLGRAGVPVFAYNFRPDPLYRTGTQPGRGGAEVTAFDLDLAKDRPLTYGRVYTAEEMWASYEYFIKAVIPTAEEAGVRLALHPDDPPGFDLGGVARIFSRFEDFERGSQIVESPNWGLLFCIGCWSEMGGNENVLRGIRHFGARGQIVYVHFRDVQGTGSKFAECFIGEGNIDVTTVMRTLKEVGFTGCLIDDHVPRMEGDTGWSPRGRAYSTGYLMGLLRAVNDLT